MERGFQSNAPFVEAWVIADDSSGVSNAVGQWRYSRCDYCKQPVVWRDEEIIYPESSPLPPPHEDMPENASELYLEARAVYKSSRRAAGVMARAVIERILKATDGDAPTRADLDTRIARMERRASAGLWKSLTIVRYIGNKAIHGGESADQLVEELMSEEAAQLAELIFETCNQLVEELITRPAAIDDAYSRVPEEIRVAAEKKAANQK